MSGRLILQQGGSPQGPPSKVLRASGRQARAAGLPSSATMPLRGMEMEQVLASSAQKDCPHHFLFCLSAQKNPTELYGLPHTFPTDRCERRKENSSGMGVA